MEGIKPVVLTFKEGAYFNYMNALHEHFGGDLTPESYFFERGKTKIQCSSFTFSENIEAAVTDAIHTEPVKMDRIPDENPDYLHLVIIHQGGYTQAYEDQLQELQADSTKGIFFYNGMFPLMAQFPANAHYQAIAFKFQKSALENLIPEALPQINQMYPSNEGIAYHISTPQEVHQLVYDIMHYNKGGFGSKAIMKARAVEAFAITLKTMQQMDDDALNGLHIDDFNRLMRIKEKVLSSITTSISVEDIAEEFAISVSKLNRDFKTLFDTTIYKFYTHAKIDEAYRRLQSGNYTVTEVSYDMGYSNPAKFSEMFKKIKGISPKEVI
nr:AraC family transcriptional regulator [uncultured Carboxylicivirga sp.]